MIQTEYFTVCTCAFVVLLICGGVTCKYVSTLLYGSVGERRNFNIVFVYSHTRCDFGAIVVFNLHFKVFFYYLIILSFFYIRSVFTVFLIVPLYT